jgi:hypothetical protein
MDNEIIIKLEYPRLRNETYVELHDTIGRVFVLFPPAQLGVVPQYTAYQTSYADVVAALDVIIKSGYTELIGKQDHQVRDHVYRGFDDAVKSALNHFNPEKHEAARRIKIVLDKYGNIAAKSFDQETAAIDNLVRELQSGDYPTLVMTLGLDDWVAQLEIENRRFKDLMMARYDETAKRPATHMRAARIATDKTFRELTRQLEALALVNGMQAYEALFRELNAVLSRYKNLLAQQTGKNKNEESEK